MKPWELDDKYLCDLWTVIEGHEENLWVLWKIGRAICFNIHRHAMGIKRPSPSQEAFWPLPCDKGENKGLSAQQLAWLEHQRQKKQHRVNGSR